ncbi:MAG: cobalamin-binding protein [Candidatus Omnitrophota bacterium]
MIKRSVLIFILLFFCSAWLDADPIKADKQKIVSIAPSTTEILFALGLDEEIVGVSTFCNYPSRAQEKEKVGTFSQPNTEKILSLQPDIVFCTGLEQAPVIGKLRQLGLNVYVSDPSSIEEMFDSIMEMAAIVGRSKAAAELIDRMKKDIETVTSKTILIPEKDKVKVFIEFWKDPLMTAGKGSFIDELIALAGGVNISSDVNRPYSYFSPEEVIKRDPDCIILAYMVNKDAAKMVGRRLGWEGIAAVKNSRIYNDINPDILLRPSPRLGVSISELYERLYP